ncbi:MAG TPA: hypothetical protein ENN80_11610 [Candidatus Hydrogenedentes bacterium]|nr:hypothetical protein [Candidatus Hydrogenedentota bacterium]
MTGVSPAPDWSLLRDIRYLTWFTSLPTLSVLVTSSIVSPDTPEKREQVGRFLAGLVGVPMAVAPEAGFDENKAASATMIIGVATACIGALLMGAVVLTPGVNALSVGVGGVMLLVGLGAVKLSKRVIAE